MSLISNYKILFYVKTQSKIKWNSEMNIMNSVIAFLFCVFFYAATKFILSFTRFKNIKRRNLLVNINQKVFMTFWLGFCFASFFLILSFFARHFLEKEFFLSLLAYGKGNPGTFFYLGGVLFASTTLLVYLVRIAGKRFYTRIKKTQNKELPCLKLYLKPFYPF